MLFKSPDLDVTKEPRDAENINETADSEADTGLEREKIEDLVARAKKGDDEAFGALAEIFEKFVYNTALRVLSAADQSPDDAEDVAQDALVKAWRYLSHFRGDCAFSTWLFRITVNTARDFIRQRSRRKTVSLTAADSDDGDERGREWDIPVTSGDELPEEAAEKKELILEVRRAIEALPPDQKTVVVMRDIHELPYQVIADTLGLELGTVKSRLNRGRANLKNILAGKGIR